jgi:hypothetical protein
MSFSQIIYRRKLAPGESDNINFPGSFFYVVNADGPIRIGPNDEDGNVYDVGTGPIGPASHPFRKLKVQNEHTADNLVEIAVGVGEFRDNRFTLVPQRNVGVPIYPAPTRFVVNPATSIAAGASVSLPGTWTAPDRIRKAIIVQNLDAALSLHIRVGNDVVNEVPGSPIPMTHTFEVSGPVNIHNPHGAPVSCRIAEIVVTG